MCTVHTGCVRAVTLGSTSRMRAQYTRATSLERQVSNGHAQKAYVFTLDRYMYVRICLKRRADDTLLQVFLVFTDFHSGTYSDPFRFPTKNLYLKRKYNLNVTEENIFWKNEKVTLRKRQTIFVDLSAILIKVMWHQLRQEYTPRQPRVYSRWPECHTLAVRALGRVLVLTRVTHSNAA